MLGKPKQAIVLMVQREVYAKNSTCNSEFPPASFRVAFSHFLNTKKLSALKLDTNVVVLYIYIDSKLKICCQLPFKVKKTRSIHNKNE